MSNKLTIPEFITHVTALGFDNRDTSDIVSEILTYGEIRINDDIYVYSNFQVTVINDAVLQAFERMLDEQRDLEV